MEPGLQVVGGGPARAAGRGGAHRELETLTGRAGSDRVGVVQLDLGHVLSCRAARLAQPDQRATRSGGEAEQVVGRVGPVQGGQPRLGLGRGHARVRRLHEAPLVPAQRAGGGREVLGRVNHPRLTPDGGGLAVGHAPLHGLDRDQQLGCALGRAEQLGLERDRCRRTGGRHAEQVEAVGQRAGVLAQHRAARSGDGGGADLGLGGPRVVGADTPQGHQQADGGSHRQRHQHPVPGPATPLGRVQLQQVLDGRRRGERPVVDCQAVRPGSQRVSQAGLEGVGGAHRSSSLRRSARARRTRLRTVPAEHPTRVPISA